MSLLSLIVLLCSPLECINDLIVLGFLHLGLLLFLLDLLAHEGDLLEEDGLLLALLVAAQVRAHAHIVHRSKNLSRGRIRLYNA